MSSIFFTAAFTRSTPLRRLRCARPTDSAFERELALEPVCARAPLRYRRRRGRVRRHRPGRRCDGRERQLEVLAAAHLAVRRQLPRIWIIGQFRGATSSSWRPGSFDRSPGARVRPARRVLASNLDAAKVATEEPGDVFDEALGDLVGMSVLVERLSQERQR